MTKVGVGARWLIPRFIAPLRSNAHPLRLAPRALARVAAHPVRLHGADRPQSRYLGHDRVGVASAFARRPGPGARTRMAPWRGRGFHRAAQRDTAVGER